MHIRPLGLTLAASVIAAISACGSTVTTGSGAPAPGSSGDHATAKAALAAPCTLLTDTQAATALGEPVDPGKASDTAAVQGCAWFGNGGATSDYVGVTYIDGASFDAAKHLNGQGNSVIQADPGVGDDAFFMINAPNALLEVRKGSVYFSVDVERAGNSDKTMEHTLGLEVAANIH